MGMGMGVRMVVHLRRINSWSGTHIVRTSHLWSRGEISVLDDRTYFLILLGQIKTIKCWETVWELNVDGVV